MLYGKEKIEEFIDKVLSTDEAFTKWTAGKPAP